ncbi:CBS domain-containing protein [Kitasatospora sp. NPDC059599]|uniref:CBS domain-containing protein n=1 Tax=Kitasatospora sp. NPDC059599 TaxID=3346880 RepID=UPI00367BBF20
MQHRNVQDVLTREVVATRPGTPVEEAAAPVRRDAVPVVPVVPAVPAVPVVDDRGRPLGTVSGADVIRGAAVRPDPGARHPGRRPTRRTAPCRP